MGYLFTRQLLYELVWSGPMTTQAKTLAISGVGLAKACRRGDIPVPPRGYWARLAAGQRVARTPLPRRAPGMSDRVTVGAGRPQAFQPARDEGHHGNEGAEDSVKEELPPLPRSMTKHWTRSKRGSVARCQRNSASCAHWKMRTRRSQGCCAKTISAAKRSRKTATRGTSRALRAASSSDGTCS